MLNFALYVILISLLYNEKSLNKGGAILINLINVHFKATCFLDTVSLHYAANYTGDWQIIKSTLYANSLR